MSWTDERVARLKELNARGESGSYIAAALGGTTRNAVIGKLHRLGVTKLKGGQAVARQPRTPRTHRLPPKRTYRPASDGPENYDEIDADPFSACTELTDLVIDESDPPFEQRVTLPALKDTSCRWPLGTPKEHDFRFCGRKTLGKFPYCPHHCRLAYKPAKART